ncbi:hypothetical protein H4W33_006441 [Kibdelosporangium phytohabitans]|nr:hypothetical protein [Kibdelosporangium phytohabitans]
MRCSIDEYFQPGGTPRARWVLSMVESHAVM